VLESLRWRQPATWKIFGVPSQEQANILSSMAFNQGFYNLFLAIGAGLGVILLPSTEPAGLALIFLAAGSMLAAALVLVSSDRSNLRPAAIQGTAPLLGLLFTVLALVA
jgi:putative membrane protein